MLNLFKLNKKNSNQSYIKVEKDRYYYKDFPISTREWSNSIYVFNKSTLGLITHTATCSIKLIKSYLSLYSSKIAIKPRKFRRFRRFSNHKIYVGGAGFKHTNDKVIVTIYTYNREKFNYLYFLNKKFLSINKKTTFKIYKRFYLIKNKALNFIKKANKDKYNLIRCLNKLGRIVNNYKITYINDYLINYYKLWVNKSLKKVKLYFYYKQLLYASVSKFNYTYLQTLKSYIEKIYSKKAEFNIINLKYHYLNSDILSESITLKITKNRRKMRKYLKRLIRKIKVCKTDKSIYYTANQLNLMKNTGWDPVEILLSNKPKLSNQEPAKQVALQEIKYKRLSGVRLEASGRLTRRYTASRSVSKLEYKGNLRNVDSTYKGLSTVILKGNLRSNLQYTKLKSKTRIGSFGIKGWVSGS